jgi:tetratricopeptide (TPR) repeat protein
LAAAGRDAAAIELLDRLFREFPEPFELAQAHSQKAMSLARLGRVDGAVQEYRAALQADRDVPSVRTYAWLDFGWLAVEQEMTHLYNEVSQVLQEFRDESDLRFPENEYRYAGIQAILAHARGEDDQARAFATAALAEAAKEHSGLRYHPRVGLVRARGSPLERKLVSLAAG